MFFVKIVWFDFFGNIDEVILTFEETCIFHLPNWFCFQLCWNCVLRRTFSIFDWFWTEVLAFFLKHAFSQWFSQMEYNFGNNVVIKWIFTQYKVILIVCTKIDSMWVEFHAAFNNIPPISRRRTIASHVVPMLGVEAYERGNPTTPLKTTEVSLTLHTCKGEWVSWV